MSTNLWQGTWRGRSPVGDRHIRSRDVVRPTGGIMRGKYPSRKNGRSVHHEGMLEAAAIYLFEASPNIARYREQVPKVRYADGDKLRRYTPDFELVLRSGEIVIVEVKPRSSLERDEVSHQLACVQAQMDRGGDHFVVLTDAHLLVEPRLTSVRWVCHQAPRLRPAHIAVQIAVRRLQRAFPTSIREAIGLFSPYGIDPFSALLCGELRCALDVPVSLDTQLELNEENSHDWFCIAQEHGF